MSVDDLFDYLKRCSITDADSAARTIQSTYSFSQVIDLHFDLAEKVDAVDCARSRERIGPFDFWPSGELGASTGGCVEAMCRARRASRLARFASLWADRITVPPLFGTLHEREPEEHWRRWTLGSVLVLLELEPLIRSGIVMPGSADYRMCPTCAPELGDALDAARVRLRSAVTQLSDDYRPELSGVFRARGAERRAILLKGPKSILPHGFWAYVYREDVSLDWLPKAVERKIDRQVQVAEEMSPRTLKRSGVVEALFKQAGDDVLSQHVAARLRSSRYITHRPIDVVLLEALNSREFYDSWNSVLAQGLGIEAPFIHDAPLTDLMELREGDDEAFLVYRDALNSLLKNQIQGDNVPTVVELKDAFESLVTPKLNKMNQKLNAAREKLSNKTRRQLKITGLTLGVGLTTGLVAAELAAIVSAVGGFRLLTDLASSHLERNDAEDEIRSEDFYFLWKLQQRAN